MTREPPPTTEGNSEEYCAAWHNGFESRDAEIAQLHAEIERLKAENAIFRSVLAAGQSIGQFLMLRDRLAALERKP